MAMYKSSGVIHLLTDLPAKMYLKEMPASICGRPSQDYLTVKEYVKGQGSELYDNFDNANMCKLCLKTKKYPMLLLKEMS